MACNHLWRGVNDRSSQCAKCGEIYTTPDPKNVRIAALEGELARVKADLAAAQNDQTADDVSRPVAGPAQRSVRPQPAAGALAFVEALSRKHYEEIGFLPKPRLEQYNQAGQLWMQTENGEPCGFLVWGNGWPVLRVYQVCIQYDAQRRLHGAELVGRLIRKAEEEGYERVSAWVADDIPANDFWHLMGFRLHGQRAGGQKRGRMHNAWVYWCTAPRQLVLLGAERKLGHTQHY